MELDVDHLRGWIGKEELSAERLTGSLVQRFNATFDRTSPCEDRKDAPLLIHLCLGQATVPTAELGPDGHPARGDFLPPVPLPSRMWAGGEFTFHAPIRIGDIVERHSRITDVVVKEGRSGTLCFVTVEHEISSGGRKALSERQDIVYRAATSTGSTQTKSDPAIAATGTQSHTINPSPVFLFRYSALTFNGHRIHYDTPYTRNEEHYPGLIVHGPLQATLLVQYAADIKKAPPAHFEFRSLSPIFDTHDFSLNAETDGPALQLWTARIGGPIAMQARAEW